MARKIKQIVFTIHGIQTHGKWQKTAAEVISEISRIPIAIDYEYFPLRKFFWPPSRNLKVEEFYTKYTIGVRDHKVNFENPLEWPSIIAHSFGTFMLGQAMMKYPDIKFDKIILSGSILPTDFDWFSLYRRDQFNRIYNQCSKEDFWARISKLAVWGSGQSGYCGFSSVPPIKKIKNERFDKFKHSDYHQKEHMRKFWVPTLNESSPLTRIEHGEDIQDQSTFGNHFSQTLKIDDEGFSALPNYLDLAPKLEQAMDWVRVEPGIYTFLMDRKTSKAIGYINAMPMHAEPFEEIKKGVKQEGQIIGKDIACFLPDTSVKMYLMSIAISKSIRDSKDGANQESYFKLAAGLLDKLERLYTEKKIKVTEFLAICWTDEGTRICRDIYGMDKIGNDPFGHEIYNLNLQCEVKLKYPKFYRHFKQLIESYNS